MERVETFSSFVNHESNTAHVRAGTTYGGVYNIANVRFLHVPCGLTGFVEEGGALGSGDGSWGLFGYASAIT